MTEAKEAPTNVVVSCEGISPVTLMIPKLSPIEIVEAIENDQDLCFFTNFSLSSKSGQLSQETNLENELTKGILNLTINVQKFTEQEILAHAQKFARIIFSTSSMRNSVDTKQSAISFILQNYQNEKQNIQINEISGIYPEKYIVSSTKDLVQFFDISPQAPTVAERMMGVFAKFLLKTFEGAEYVVNANENGFYVKPDKVFKSLHLLCISLSKHFKGNYTSSSKKWTELTKLERRPFKGTNSTIVYFPGTKATGELGLFQQDYNQVDGNIDDVIDALPEDAYKDVYINSIEQSFIKSAVDGIMMIKRGFVAPINEEGSFYYNDLFISPVSGLIHLYEGKGGFDGLNRTFCNDVRVYPFIKNIDPNFRVCRTLIVDYFNERWFVQTLVPGLIYQKAKIVHGFKPEDKTKYLHEEEYSKMFEKNAEILGLAASRVKGSEKEIFCTSAATGVIGSDGNKYIVDLHNITPRDANFPDPVKHNGCIIRVEAVRQFEIFKTLEKHAAELEKLGGKREFLYKGESKEVMKLRADILENIEKIKFDVNALTLEAADDKIPENIADIAKFIKEILIPLFINEHVLQNKFISCGHSFVDEMHARGINARYLGHVAKLIKEKEQNELINATIKIIESEIIVRSIKYYIRNMKIDIPSFISFMNKLLGKSGSKQEQAKLVGEIAAIAKEKFDYEIKEIAKSQHNLIVTGILNDFGIVVSPTTTAEKLSLESIVDVVPRFKFAFTKNTQIEQLVELGTALYLMNDYKSSESCFQTAVQGTVDPNDKVLSTSFFYLALIAVSQEKYDAAFSMLVRSLTILEHYCDETDQDIIIRYTILAEVAALLKKPKLTFVLYERAASLSSFICPFHPFAVSSAVVAAETGSLHEDKFGATLWMKAIELCSQQNNDSSTLAALYHSASLAAFKSGNSTQAIQYAEKTCSLDKNEQYQTFLQQLKETAGKGKKKH